MTRIVTDIHVHRYADRIATQLLAHGSARSQPCDDPLAWRAVARMVARGLNRPVQTLLSHDGAAHAALTDFPRDDTERAVHEASMGVATAADSE